MSSVVPPWVQAAMNAAKRPRWSPRYRDSGGSEMGAPRGMRSSKPAPGLTTDSLVAKSKSRVATTDRRQRRAR